MLSKLRKQEGFTLIELLIVVAIIGILAAIAIPQFAAYRVRGFNSAAQADLRNMLSSEEAFFADHQCYASSGAAGAPTLTALITGPNTTPIAVPANGITATQPQAAANFNINLSNGVSLVIQTAALGANHTIVTKHVNGDRWYGADSQPTLQVVSIGTVASRGVLLAAADGPAATAVAGANNLGDFDGVTPTGAGATAWTAN